MYNKTSQPHTFCLKTERLVMRQPTAADFLILSDLWRDVTVRQFLGGTLSDDVIEHKTSAIHDHWVQYGFGLWSVSNNQQQVLGVCGLYHSEDGIELSYMFFPRYWGQGFAKEAALASVKYGLTELKLEKIIAITQETNYKSCRLLENIGMQSVNTFSRFNARQRLYEKLKFEKT